MLHFLSVWAICSSALIKTRLILIYMPTKPTKPEPKLSRHRLLNPSWQICQVKPPRVEMGAVKMRLKDQISLWLLNASSCE